MLTRNVISPDISSIYSPRQMSRHIFKWRDMKKEVAPSVTLGTFTGALVGLIEQLGDEHRVHLAKTFVNLFPSAQIITKRTYDKIQSIHYRTLLLSGILTTIQSKLKGAMSTWYALSLRWSESHPPVWRAGRSAPSQAQGVPCGHRPR